MNSTYTCINTYIFMISNLRYELYDRLFSGIADKELKNAFWSQCD